MSRRVLNFNAGPAALPIEVLEEAQRDLLDYNGSGMSVMEASHRAADFENIIKEAEQNLRSLMSIPANYKVLFLQGGGSLQFAQVPMNLLAGRPRADYLVTGTWSQKAAQEAAKFCEVNVAASSEEKNGSFRSIPPAPQWKLTTDGSAAYLYYCANETVHGIEFPSVPEVGPEVILVADCSSNFLSRVVDVNRFGLIFAGAQKNVGPSGVTIVIVREDLLGKAVKFCPSVMDYKVMASNGSLYNTPPTWSIYVTGLVLKHLISLGGIRALEEINSKKAHSLYTFVDASRIYVGPVDPAVRSRMNVIFRVCNTNKEPDPKAEKKFADDATKQGLVGLAGHRSVGGMRASLYNAVSLEAVERLITFMRDFEEQALSNSSKL